ncbi:minor tail protein [Streptomyces phage Madamato]|nr:minor tail protein [Streptomyces phage Madamato]
MLTRVEVRNNQGDLFKLVLEDPSSGFIVADIDGLGPVKATLVSSSFAGMDGEQYQSSRRDARNLKFKLELDPDPATDTVWSLRDKLYDFFMPKSQITLQFFREDGLVVEIPGVVETCEPDHFAQEPTMDISIMCFKPDFYELASRTIDTLLTTDTTATYFDYEGTAETGVIFELTVDRAVDELTVYHRIPSGEIQTLTYDNAPLIAGDILTISTVSGDKRATLNRGGTISSVLYGISPQSKWIELQRGSNGIRMYATGAAIPVTMTYITRYGGL